MFLAEKFVYLQLQKTGCTHIAKQMQRFSSGQSYGKKHGRLPLDMDLQDRKIIGSIRNPWDWYVSLWAFGCGDRGGLHKRLTSRFQGLGMGKYGFRSLRYLPKILSGSTKEWADYYQDSSDASAFRRWLHKLFDPSSSIDLGVDYAFSPLSRYAGFLTFRYQYLYTMDVSKLLSKRGPSSLEALYDFDENNNMLDFCIRNESIADDLAMMFSNLGIELPDSKIRGLQSEKRTNASNRVRDISYYYDNETSLLVSEKESFIIGKYQYLPPV